MARKLISGVLLLIMAASVLACGVAETRPTDTSLQNTDQNTDQTTVIIGGDIKYSVTGVVK